MSSSTGHSAQFADEPRETRHQFDVVPEVSATLDALEEFAQFTDELYDSQKPRKILWEGNPNRIAIRSVGRVLCKYRHAVKPNRPPGALIVRLSRKLPGVLQEVCERPKHILQRRRSIEPLNRIRELDSSCVRWLTRQPGNTLAEKSGHRRSILAVQRYESVDTLENRVVVDLLRRCATLASDYLRQYQGRFPNHPWMRNTANFLSLCRRLQNLPQLHDVAGLPSLPKPNYVLLHESRYQQIWRAYTEVIRQQRRRQQLWMWRHSAYADMMTIALMNSASRLATRRNRKRAHRFELFLRESPLRGQFFDWMSPPPIWQVTPQRSLFVGPIQHAQHWAPDLLPHDPSVQVCAVVQQESSARVLGLTAMFPDDPANQSSDTVIQPDQVVLNVVEMSKPWAMTSPAKECVPLDMTKHPRCLDRLVWGWCLA